MSQPNKLRRANDDGPEEIDRRGEIVRLGNDRFNRQGAGDRWERHKSVSC